ncbi:MAG1430 family protein [Mycoplasmopsis cricetuli]|uniref:MAG1430 family protein n=1 Tax=Mycoplasmopsis cricetuli TaxID=171283 RepID=UPI00046F9BBD|nr:hypothetical protein [Mycoplasmopsis cricetuli]
MIKNINFKFKSRWNDIRKIIIPIIAITETITIVGLSIGLAQANKNKQKTNHFDQFFLSFTKKGEEIAAKKFASQYASNNSILNSKFTSALLRDQFIFKKIFDQNKINQEKFFTLTKADGTLLNFFNDTYDLSFSSYADDVNGKLLIKVNLITRGSVDKKENIEQIYELDGFQKITPENYKKYMFLSDLSFNISSFADFESFDDFKNQYTQADSLKKGEINSKILNFNSSPTSTLNFLKTTLIFKDDYQFEITPVLSAVANNASKENLNATTILDQENFYVKTPIKFLSLKQYFDFKTNYSSKISFNQSNIKNLNNLTFDDFKKTFNKNLQRFNLLGLENIPQGYSYKMIEDIQEDQQNYIFKYLITNNISGLVEYSGKIKLNKFSFKQTS